MGYIINIDHERDEQNEKRKAVWVIVNEMFFCVFEAID